MNFRIVSGLKWARPMEGRPAGLPIGRPRGAKRQGVKYERDFAKALGNAGLHGQWFEFWDANGKGICQPDFILRTGDNIVVLECKYTWVETARWQIEKLYKPVVEASYGLRASGITVVKHLVPDMHGAKVVADLEEAIRLSLTLGARKEVVLHWLAGSPFVGKVKPVERAAAAALMTL